jgi:aryl-alcohol dehydrogenase-like predicted oxidoreductase
MEYRTLGKTGLRISEISFGCGAVGGLMTADRHEEQVGVIRRALDLGITHFDTASSYGDGTSEANLGKVLKEIEPEITLSTKVRLGPERPDDLKEATIASVDQSLKRLGRDAVDVIQLHDNVADGEWAHFSLTSEDVLGPVLEAFQTLRDRGKVRFFGFTALGEPGALHALVESGEFHTAQVYYNLLNPTAGYPAPAGFQSLDYGRLLEKAAAHDMGVFAIRVLARGALTDAPRTGGKEPRSLSPGSEYSRDVERARKLGWLTGGEDGTLAQTAFRFALMRPEVSAALAGCASIKEVEETAACSEAGGLSEEVIARLKGLWESDFE